MDFNKPICAVVEGDDDSKKLREYFERTEKLMEVKQKAYSFL